MRAYMDETKPGYIGITNDSADHKYFTMIPNVVLEHYGAVTQALYCHIKKHAGDKGTFSVSDRNLMKKLKVGRIALKDAFNDLIKENWIVFTGMKDVETDGGPQKVKTYSIVDIWPENVMFYKKRKGAADTAPLNERCGSNDIKGAVQTAPNKNPLNKMGIPLDEEGDQTQKQKKLSPEEVREKLQKIRKSFMAVKPTVPNQYKD